MSGLREKQCKARQVADALVANGAVFTYRAASGSFPASFTYELSAGGDRQACRATIARAKGDAALWHAVVDEIGARCARGVA